MKTKLTLAMIATTLGTSLAVAHSPNVIEVLTQAGRAQGAVPSSDLEAKTRQFLKDNFKVKGQDWIKLPATEDAFAKVSNFRQASSSSAYVIYRSFFYAGHGDKNQRPNEPYDLRANHGPWPVNMPSIPPSVMVETDKVFYAGASTIGQIVPMNIAGYPAFTVPNVREASLKVDVLFDPSVPQMQGNYLVAWNDQTGQATQLMRPQEWAQFWGIVRERDMHRRWVSIVFDLTPTTNISVANVYDINGYGNPIPGRYIGPFMGIPAPVKTAVLDAAKNGNLQLYALPYCVVSHAELVVKAL